MARNILPAPLPQPSPITSSQWKKVSKAFYYSFGSGFVAGLMLAATDALSHLTNGGSLALTRSLAISLVTAGLVGGLNALAVTIKQLFTEPN